MSQDVDITEVSDPQDLTIDAPVDSRCRRSGSSRASRPIEDMAALVAVLAGGGGGRPEPGPQELNLWGHPGGQAALLGHSWQRVTLVERTHMRR